MSLPANMLAHLSAGGSVDATMNLIDDRGVSNLPDGVKTTFKISQKMTNLLQVIKTSDSGVTWAVTTVTKNYVANTITFSTAPAIGDLIIVSSEAQNKALIQSSPLPVVQVLPKAIATNSHSLYKGGLLTNSITGGVSTGNGSNGLESIVLENWRIGNYDYIAYIGSSLNLVLGDRVLLGEDLTYASKGDIVFHNNSSASFTVTAGSFDYNGNAQWSLVDYSSTPTHSTLSLDNSNSIACKAFGSLALLDNQYVVQVNGEEMVWDYSKDDKVEFVSRTNLDTSLPISNEIYHITSGFRAGYWVALNPVATKIEDVGFSEVGNNLIGATGTIHWTRWDGNGFGEDGTFGQLTNGIDTDLNGNIVKTFSGYIPTGYFKEEV